MIKYLDVVNNKEENLNLDVQYARTDAISSREKFRRLKSNTKVGCCIKATDGLFYSGCNFDFEFGIAVHGEESAIINMINNATIGAMIDFVYIYAEVSSSSTFTSCGNCRDKMRLFANNKKDMKVFFDNGNKIKMIRLGDLIPYYPER